MRILLVEDHPDTSDVMARLLEKHGHNVTPAATAHEAERLCGIMNFDAMVCDLMLPDRDGWTLAAVARNCGMPAIAVSALAMATDVAASKRAGFADHLVKPVTIATLNAALVALPASHPPHDGTGFQEGIGGGGRDAQAHGATDSTNR